MEIFEERFKKVIEKLNKTAEKPSMLSEVVFRPWSDKYFDTLTEMKQRYRKGKVLAPNEWEREILESDIGERVLFEGVEVPLDMPIPEEIYESEYKGKKVQLNKPQRGGSKKYFVFVRDPKTKNIKKVSFGAKGMSVGIDDPERRRSFVARHDRKNKTDKTKAGYWSCRLPRYAEALGLKKTGHQYW